jgi:4-amino-4-deoxy-L-arabinose transferase-like glycosyltransferase
VPRAAWACALVATLSAVCWSLITPPFQLPDEPSHFAYAQLLAETGHLPSSSNNTFSPEETTILSDLDQPGVRWHPEVGTISAGPQQQALQRDLARPLSRVGAGGAGVAATEPPLYYALETIPYQLGSGGTLLDRLELMRLLSALMAGLTALFTYMFVREALPAARWAWIVGGLSAALAPLLGFTSGGVTPDAMLFAVCAAIFYCLARAFRRGLTWRLALATGTLIAAGFLTKVNFVGLVPGLLLGLLVLGLRGVPGVEDADRRGRAFGPAAAAAAIAVSPVCVYVVRNLLEHHPTLGIVSSAYSQQGHDSLASDFTYIWQLYLPRLPGMYDYFPGLSTLRQVWFDRAVGLYGWLDTDFPEWVYTVALIPAGLIAILALRALLASRRALRPRLSELAVYLTISVGLMVLIAQDSHLNRSLEGVGYAQPRYLMPLMPLGAGVLVLAARGAGRRWGPAAGVLILTLFLAQDIFSQLLVVSRFYA